jgi:monofunctional glycosyltransferase
MHLAVHLAAIAAEDQRFPMHGGFDVEAINTALRDAENGASLRGASTITQQVAKFSPKWINWVAQPIFSGCKRLPKGD